MRLFLDCEFTQLTAQAKLISLALVGQDRREFYVEVIDAWREEDCSEFVKEIVLSQLWGGEYAMPILKARSALLQFLATYDEELDIATDAHVYDWELFCELAYDDGKWPTIEPGAIDSELKFGSSHEASAQAVVDFYINAIPAESVARAIAFAIEQPADVDINEIVLRPTSQDF